MALDYKLKIKYKRKEPTYIGFKGKKYNILIYNKSTDDNMVYILKKLAKMLDDKKYDLRELNVVFFDNTLELVFLEHDDEIDFIEDLVKYGIINEE